MTLLLDHNLSYRLKRPFDGRLDEVVHITDPEMDEAEDIDIWRHAQERG